MTVYLRLRATVPVVLSCRFWPGAPLYLMLYHYHALSRACHGSILEFVMFKCISLLLLCLSSLCLSAGKGVQEDPLLTVNRYPLSGIIPQIDNAKRAMNLEDILLLDPGSSLEHQREYVDTLNGGTITRYRQQFMGIPLFGGELSVSRAASGKVGRLHGYLTQGLDERLLDTLATLTGADALALLRQRTLSMGDWQLSNEQAELVIFIDQFNHPHLAWSVNFFATDHTGNATRPYQVLSAINGRVLQQWEGLTTNEVGTGPGGNQITGPYEYGADFPFFAVTVNGSTYTMDTPSVRTVNQNSGTTASAAYSFTGPRNTYTAVNGAYCPLNDAHHMGGVLVDMYNDLVGVPPLSFKLVMNVHYGNNLASAFWNGSGMYFGDGGLSYYPLTVMDVAGHEVSHGFTEQHSGLVYSNQAGGINEAFSDIAGETAEFYSTGSNDWQMGAEILRGGGALRYLNNPPLDGISIDNQADYTAGMDPHYSSGVFNKAFYVLSTTSGWSITQAFAVFARANRLYWTSNVDFNVAACGVIDAANDLGYATADVENAFDAVGVTCGTTPPSCQPRGGPCTQNDDCCSGNCRGRKSVCR